MYSKNILKKIMIIFFLSFFLISCFSEEIVQDNVADKSNTNNIQQKSDLFEIENADILCEEKLESFQKEADKILKETEKKSNEVCDKKVETAQKDIDNSFNGELEKFQEEADVAQKMEIERIRKEADEFLYREIERVRKEEKALCK